MPHVFGQDWTRKEITSYTGANWQVGGVRHLKFMEGQEDGTEVVQFDTGTGLTFNVHPSRGLDIACAKYCGASLSFDLPCGEAHPAHFDPHGIGWLKTFFSGLLTTCGMTWAGAMCEDEGTALGIHGRYSHLAARYLKIGDDWDGDRRRLWVSGEIRESVLFGCNVVMRRTISTEVGSNTIHIEDRVSNEGFSETPHMMIYHINIGFPVLTEHTQLITNATKVIPRDEVAEKGFRDFARFDKPIVNFQEQFYSHELKPDAQGFCHTALVNPQFHNGRGFGVQVSYRQKELPRFGEWKMTGAGNYVCGLEPANCHVRGRAWERKQGTLEFLQPGQEKIYRIDIAALPDNQAIEDVKAMILR